LLCIGSSDGKKGSFDVKGQPCASTTRSSGSQASSLAHSPAWFRHLRFNGHV